MLKESRFSPGWGPGLGETSCPRSLLSAGFRGFEVRGDGTGVPRRLCTTGRQMGYKASCPLSHWSNPPRSPKGECRCLKLSASKRREVFPILNLKGKRNSELGRWSFAHPQPVTTHVQGRLWQRRRPRRWPGWQRWGPSVPRPRPPPACAAPGPRATSGSPPDAGPALPPEQDARPAAPAHASCPDSALVAQAGMSPTVSGAGPPIRTPLTLRDNL